MSVIKEETKVKCKIYIHDDFIQKEEEKKKEKLKQIAYIISLALLQKDKKENID